MEEIATRLSLSLATNQVEKRLFYIWFNQKAKTIFQWIEPIDWFAMLCLSLQVKSTSIGMESRRNQNPMKGHPFNIIC